MSIQGTTSNEIDLGYTPRTTKKAKFSLTPIDTTLPEDIGLSEERLKNIAKEKKPYLFAGERLLREKKWGLGKVMIRQATGGTIDSLARYFFNVNDFEMAGKVTNDMRTKDPERPSQESLYKKLLQEGKFSECVQALKYVDPQRSRLVIMDVADSLMANKRTQDLIELVPLLEMPDQIVVATQYMIWGLASKAKETLLLIDGFSKAILEAYQIDDPNLNEESAVDLFIEKGKTRLAQALCKLSIGQVEKGKMDLAVYLSRGLPWYSLFLLLRSISENEAKDLLEKRCESYSQNHIVDVCETFIQEGTWLDILISKLEMRFLPKVLELLTKAGRLQKAGEVLKKIDASYQASFMHAHEAYLSESLERLQKCHIKMSEYQRKEFIGEIKALIERDPIDSVDKQADYEKVVNLSLEMVAWESEEISKGVLEICELLLDRGAYGFARSIAYSRCGIDQVKFLEMLNRKGLYEEASIFLDEVNRSSFRGTESKCKEMLSQLPCNLLAKLANIFIELGDTDLVLESLKKLDTYKDIPAMQEICKKWLGFCNGFESTGSWMATHSLKKRLIEAAVYAYRCEAYDCVDDMLGLSGVDIKDRSVFITALNQFDSPSISTLVAILNRKGSFKKEQRSVWEKEELFRLSEHLQGKSLLQLMKWFIAQEEALIAFHCLPRQYPSDYSIGISLLNDVNANKNELDDEKRVHLVDYAETHKGYEFCVERFLELSETSFSSEIPRIFHHVLSATPHECGNILSKLILKLKKPVLADLICFLMDQEREDIISRLFERLTPSAFIGVIELLLETKEEVLDKLLSREDPATLIPLAEGIGFLLEGDESPLLDRVVSQRGARSSIARLIVSLEKQQKWEKLSRLFPKISGFMQKEIYAFCKSLMINGMYGLAKEFTEFLEKSGAETSKDIVRA